MTEHAPIRPKQTASQESNLFPYRSSLFSARCPSSNPLDTIILDYIKLQQSPQAAWLPERAASSWSALTDATPRLQIAIEDGDEKEGMDEPEPPHATQSMLMELKVKEYYENFMKENRVSGTDAVLFLISVLTFCADVGLDIHLTINYLRQGEICWGSVTLALILFPSLVMMGFSLFWYCLDERSDEGIHRSAWGWRWRILLHVLQLAPIVRLTEGLLYGCRSKRSENGEPREAFRLARLRLRENADAAMLRLMEGFMEAAPQLILQLYIIFTQFSTSTPSQYASCFTSWVSLAVCLTAYQMALRSAQVEKFDLRWRLGAPQLYFGWKLGILASRILAIALLAVGLGALPQHIIPAPIPLVLVILGHWTLAFIFLFGIGTTFCSDVPGTPREIIFDAFLAVVFCFDVVNVKEGRYRGYYTCYYGLMLFDNTAAMTLWYFLVGIHMDRWLAISAAIVVFIAFFFGIAMMICYYLFAHPTCRIT